MWPLWWFYLLPGGHKQPANPNTSNPNTYDHYHSADPCSQFRYYQNHKDGVRRLLALTRNLSIFSSISAMPGASILAGISVDIETVSFQMALASLYKTQGAHDKALRVLLEADKIMLALTRNLSIFSSISAMPGASILAGISVDVTAVMESNEQTQKSIETVSFQMALASLYKTQGAHDKALRACGH
jgi:hypothetical protein